jgi:hypothetical protein
MHDRAEHGTATREGGVLGAIFLLSRHLQTQPALAVDDGL